MSTVQELPFEGREIAKLFIETARNAPGGVDKFASDTATMTAWFANAVMRGYDERARLPLAYGTAEELAQLFHETYEGLAPSFGYETREASAKPWADVPEKNRKLMIAVCGKIMRSFRATAAHPAGVHHAGFAELLDEEPGLLETEPILKFFRYAHLPPHLQAVSAPFGELAAQAVQTCGRSSERTEGLRKLLEAKDCIVRAYL